MTPKQINQRALRAYKAAKAFRCAAIDASACAETYTPRNSHAARWLRDIAELSTSVAFGAVIETSPRNIK